MSHVRYKRLKFGEYSRYVIEHAQAILAEYEVHNISITARSLHYQFVARNLYDEGAKGNTQKNYKKLCTIINRAKLAGLISWQALEDTTRQVETPAAWRDPADFMQNYAHKVFGVDFWDNQEYRPYVLIEKDAVVGSIQAVCNGFRVPYLSCRGYASGTVLWSLGQELLQHSENGQIPIIFHLGDHDPSGIDMTRDNRERLSMFAENDIEVIRVALNRDQVDKYQPPPNFAKTKDGRSAKYIAEHGKHSWELDALNPMVTSGLVKMCIEELINDDAWSESKKREAAFAAELQSVGARWKHALKAAKEKR